MPHLSQATNTPQVFQETDLSVSSDEIWTIRVGNGTTSSTTAGTSTQIWTAWNRSYSSSVTVTSGTARVLDTVTVTGNQIIANQTTSVSNGEIWTVWNRAYNVVRPVTSVSGRALTANERQALEAQRAAENARWQEQRRAVEAEEAQARERAEKLLQASLDDRQRAELAANGFFDLDVISRNGERRRYRIHRKWSHSIHQVDPASGRRLKTLCIHPRETVPIADSMLTQKLMLESGMEDELLRIANHS
jgi:hypothetical protein